MRTNVRPSLTTVLALAVILFLPVLAIKTYFADSEIWSVNLGYNLPDEVQNYWVFSRLLFYSLIFSATRLFIDPVNIFFAARGLMLLNALAQALLVFHIVDHYFKSRVANWFSILLLTGNTYYLTQSYRIRSDLLTTTIVLAVLLAFLKIQNSNKRILILLLGMTSALLTTPKAIFILPVLMLIFIWDHKDAKKWHYVLGLFGTILLIFTSSLFLRLGVFSDLALDLSHYLQRTLSGNETGISYLSRKSFFYVNKLFGENPWLAIAWSLPYILIKNQKDLKWISVHSFLLSLLFLAPEKLPFYICSLIPLLTCTTVILLNTSLAGAYPKQILSAGVAISSLIIFAAASFKIMTFIHSDSNKEQITAIKSINSYLSENPGVKYYDVIGLSPAHARLRHFAGPNQSATNKLIADIIINEKPDVLLSVAKFDFFGDKIIRLLENDYIHVGNGFYIRSFTLPSHLQEENEFFAAQENGALNFLSPLFDRYDNKEFVFEVKEKTGARMVFSGAKNFFNNRPSVEITISKVSPLPMPEVLPPRNLHQLFRFDSEF